MKKIMQSLRAITALLLVCLLLLGMASCVTYDMTADLSAFGEVSIALCATMEQETYALLSSEYPGLFEQYKVETCTEEGTEMVRVAQETLHFASFEEAEAGLAQLTLPLNGEDQTRLFKSVNLYVYEDNIWFKGTVNPVDDGTGSATLRITVNMPAITVVHPDVEKEIAISEDRRSASFEVTDESFFFCVVSGPLSAARAKTTVTVVIVAVIAAALLALGVVFTVIAVRRSRAAKRNAVRAKEENISPTVEE